MSRWTAKRSNRAGAWHQVVAEDLPDELVAMAKDFRVAVAIAQLLDAAKATLLYHAGGPWSPEMAQEWRLLTGRQDATTKALCDFIRDVIAKAEGQP